MRYDVVTIVSSRRGSTQLHELVSQLPPEFGMPIVCLAESDARLVSDLAAITSLHVKWAEAGETMKAGHIYVSPPGASIVFLENKRIALAPFGSESTAQHPVDSFLASAGRAYGNRALAVVLAAFRDDGAEGAHSFKWGGGHVLVLDRATAEFYGMADAIVKAGSYDHILAAGEVANALRATFTGRDLLESAELQFELGLLLDSALRISGTHLGNVQLAEPVTANLHLVAHRGLDKRFVEQFGIVHADEPLPCARALRLRCRVVIEDVFSDPGYARYFDIARATGYRAVQSTPIIDGPEVGGVFSTLYPHHHAVTRREASDLDEIAEAAKKLVAQRR